MENLTTQLINGGNLAESQVAEAVEILLTEDASLEPRQSFLKALAQKGETPAEIAFFVRELLKRAVRVPLGPEDVKGPLIDVCGTGGDRLGLFNVSTASMFVLAAAGAFVVKHGNRGITSKSGGADVLETLGVRIDLSPEDLAECVKSTGAGFLFAPLYHPAFKAVGPVRKALAEEGQVTIFNKLGPLLNPVQPEYQLAGVFMPELLPVYAEIFALLGRKSAWVVHGTEASGLGMDEMSVNGRTAIHSVKNGKVEQLQITPEALGIPAAQTFDLLGGDAMANARVIEAILDGSDQGAKRDIVALNAAGAIVAAGIKSDIYSAFKKAKALIENGAALAKLNALRAFGK